MKALVLLLFLVVGLFSSEKLEKVSLQLQWFDQFQFAGYYIAKEKGFYKDVGLDVEIKSFKIDEDIVEKVVTNQVQYATGKNSLLISKSLGKNIYLMSAILQTSPLVFISKKSSGINSIKDFKNKKIMLSSNKKSASIFAMTMSEGLHRNDMTILKGKNKIKSLIDGDIDIMSAYMTNEVYKLKKMKIDINIFNPREYGFDFYSDILFTNENEYTKHHERVHNFNNASLRGWRYAFDNIDKTVELIFSKYNSQNKTKDELYYEAHELKKLAFYETDTLGKITKEKIEKIYNTYRLMGLLKDKVNIDKLILHDENVNLKLNKKEKEYLKNKKEITVCVKKDWLPYEGIEGGKFIGISADFLNLYAKKLSLPLKIIQAENQTEVMKLFYAKKCDIKPVISAYTHTKLPYNSTREYFKDSISLITRIEQPFVKDFKLLHDKKIVIAKGFTRLIKFIKLEYPELQITEVKDIPTALELVSSKNAFGYIGTSLVSSHYIQDEFSKKLKIVNSFKHSSFGFGIVNTEEKLLTILNKVMKTTTEKEKRDILNRWITVTTEYKIDYMLILKIVFFFLIILAFILYYNKKFYDLKERFKLAHVGNDSGVWDWDLVNDSVYLSKRWKEIIGYSENELENSYLSWENNVHPDDLQQALEDIQKHVDGKIDFYKNIHRLRHKDGHWIWIHDSGKRILDKKGKVIRMVGTIKDITKQKELEKQLEEQRDVLYHQANHDALTGLPNRALFYDRLEKGIQKAKRYKTNLALLFIDLDKFKVINDNFGHEIGDEVLKVVANRLKKTIREEDTLARLGGDEFTIIIGDVTSEKDIETFAQKVLDSLKEPMGIKEDIFNVSISVGISFYPKNGTDSSHLIKCADTAMYKAKECGRNNFQFFS